jgi:hypothetical protein
MMKRADGLGDRYISPNGSVDVSLFYFRDIGDVRTRLPNESLPGLDMTTALWYDKELILMIVPAETASSRVLCTICPLLNDHEIYTQSIRLLTTLDICLPTVAMSSVATYLPGRSMAMR